MAKRARSAVTGRYVPMAEAKRNPKQTVVERDKAPLKGKPSSGNGRKK